MNKLWWLVIVVLLGIGIYLFTGSYFSSDAFTHGLLRNLDFTEGAIEILETLLRKGAHMLEFGLAAIIVYLVLPKRRWSYPVAWAAATILGITDEIHQMYLPGRTALVSDVAIDSLGALLALFILYRIRKGSR